MARLTTIQKLDNAIKELAEAIYYYNKEFMNIEAAAMTNEQKQQEVYAGLKVSRLKVKVAEYEQQEKQEAKEDKMADDAGTYWNERRYIELLAENTQNVNTANHDVFYDLADSLLNQYDGLREYVDSQCNFTESTFERLKWDLEAEFNYKEE